MLLSEIAQDRRGDRIMDAVKAKYRDAERSPAAAWHRPGAAFRASASASSPASWPRCRILPSLRSRAQFWPSVPYPPGAEG